MRFAGQVTWHNFIQLLWGSCFMAECPSNALCCKSSLFEDVVHLPGPGQLSRIVQFSQPMPCQPGWVHLVSSLSLFPGGPELKPLCLVALQ